MKCAIDYTLLDEIAIQGIINQDAAVMGINYGIVTGLAIVALTLIVVVSRIRFVKKIKGY